LEDEVRLIKETGKFEVGFHSWSFASLPLERALRHIRDAGFSEVEIEADKIHLDPRLFPRSELPHLRKILQNLGLHPDSVHAPIDGVDLCTPYADWRRRTLSLLVDMLEYCSAIECPIMVVHPNHSESLSIGREAMRKNSVEALKELIGRAENLGVKVALENMIDKANGRFGGRVSDLREIIDDIGSASVGICFDTGHANLFLSRSITQEEEIAEGGEYLWTLHIHDNDGKEDRHWPPGDGCIDWDQVIRSLRKVNYQGVFMMEVQERGNPDELAKTSLQNARKILGNE